jgi:hypothetical protein
MNFGFMNVILLYSDLRHVSATHVAIFRVVNTRTQIRIYFNTNTYILCRDGRMTSRKMSVVTIQ